MASEVLSTAKPLTVNYIHERPGISYGNIMWSPAHPARNGKYPASHPASPSSQFGFQSECGDGDKMKAFRALGYWASCFPEGDGITMKTLNGQSPEQVVADIKAVFGWETKNV